VFLVHLVIAHTHRVLLAKPDVWRVVPRLQRNGRVVGPCVVEYSRQAGGTRPFMNITHLRFFCKLTSQAIQL
jgi:hypothetical protein